MKKCNGNGSFFSSNSDAPGFSIFYKVPQCEYVCITWYLYCTRVYFYVLELHVCICMYVVVVVCVQLWSTIHYM
jgi:hypothetical protein